MKNEEVGYYGMLPPPRFYLVEDRKITSVEIIDEENGNKRVTVPNIYDYMFKLWGMTDEVLDVSEQWMNKCVKERLDKIFEQYDREEDLRIQMKIGLIPIDMKIYM